MAYFIHTPENAPYNKQEQLELVAASKDDMKYARYDLLSLAFEHYFADTDSLDADSVDTLMYANSSNLPVELVGELLGDQDAKIMDKNTGLTVIANSAAYMKLAGLPPNQRFEIPITSVSAEDAISHEITQDSEFNRQVIRQALTHFAFQLQPLRIEDKYEVREHYSLGVLDETGSYQPVLTVLDPSHPVRLAAETHQI